MQFSDTSTKQGLIQEIEFWTNLGDGVVSGDTTLLKQFTNRLNRAYDSVLPLIMLMGDKMRWDDLNHTKHPIGTFNITSGTGDYELLSDEQGNSVLNITDLMILPSSSSTEYAPLTRLTLDDPRALRAMSPNPSYVGIPSAFVEKDNVVFFDVVPNYSATAGGKIFFERAPSYFAYTDTTKMPGIPSPFHPLLALHAAKDWLTVNKPENQVLIAEIKAEIAKQEANLSKAIQLRNPIRRRISGTRTKSI